MGRRVGDVDAMQCSEPPKKRNRTVSESLNLKNDIEIDQSLPPGEILTDVTQKQWRIGKPIGCGSFGEIYLASDDVSKEANRQNSRYVIKVEPHSNGPLFVEIHCLIRSARRSKIIKWQKEKKLNALGMPHYIANGSHVSQETRYRFLVLPRYDCDIEKIINSSTNRRLDSKNVLVLATQIINVLEYLHSQGYAHSDIKSSNLMVGFDGESFKEKKIKCYETSMKRGMPKNKSKTKCASYYYDEDYVLHNYLSSTSNTDYESDENANIQKPTNLKNLKRTKQKNIGMKRLFNLRKLKSDVNYEDISSICSYDSYQDLIDNNKNYANYNGQEDEGVEEVDHFKESIESQSSGQVYLLDFGLASKFLNADGSHKEYTMDQRKAHNGTLEYSSRDSHIGAHSRRSDLENLGYNIVDWMTGGLPWKSAEMLLDPNLVHAVKKNYVNDVKSFMEICFKSQMYPKFIENYFLYLKTLEFDQKPDYIYCKELFINEFLDRRYGSEVDMVLDFSDNPNSSPRKNKHPSKNTPPDFLKRNAIVKVFGRENSHKNYINDLKLELIRESLSNDGIRKPCASRNFFISDADLFAKLRQTLLLSHETPSKKFSPKNLRSKKIIKKRKGGRNMKSSIGKFGKFLGSDKQYTWAEILAGNPERIIRKDKDKNNQSADSMTENGKIKRPRSRKVSNASESSSSTEKCVVDGSASLNLLKPDFLKGLNPTYAMMEVVENYKRKMNGLPLLKPDECESQNIEGYTPAMIRVISNMEKRLKREQLEEKNMKKISTEKLPFGRVVRSCRTSKEKVEKTPVKVSKSKATVKKTPVKSKKVVFVEDNKEQPKIKVKAKAAIKAVQPSNRGRTKKSDSSDNLKVDKQLNVRILRMRKSIVSSISTEIAQPTLRTTRSRGVRI